MNEVTQLESQLESLKELQERRDMAIRLSQNTDFRKLILDFFCRDECARYTHASCDPSIPADQRADALSMAQSSGHLRRFLSVVAQMGHTADGTIPDIQEAIEEARAEEDAAE